MICFADADHFPLWHYFLRAGVPLKRIDRGAAAARVIIVYLVTPALPDYQALAAKSGFSAATLFVSPMSSTRSYRETSPVSYDWISFHFPFLTTQAPFPSAQQRCGWPD